MLQHLQEHLSAVKNTHFWIKIAALKITMKMNNPTICRCISYSKMVILKLSPCWFSRGDLAFTCQVENVFQPILATWVRHPQYIELGKQQQSIVFLQKHQPSLRYKYLHYCLRWVFRMFRQKKSCCIFVWFCVCFSLCMFCWISFVIPAGGVN